MPFYVRLGPRGLIFRVGTLLVHVVGSAVYWRASRRRGRIPLVRVPSRRPEKSAGLARSTSVGNN